MADQIHEQCWTEESLSAFGIYITPELVADALKDYWHLFAEGRLGHNKVFVPLDREGCTEGALVGFVGDYSGVKSIHSNPSNARYKEPTSHIDVVTSLHFPAQSRNRNTSWQLTVSERGVSLELQGPLSHRSSDNVPGWTEGALIGYFGRYSGTKDIHFAPTNAATGKPLQHSDIFLRDKVSGTLLMSVEGVAISNGRTGWFSLACVNLLLQGREDIDVFLFGAGKVAEAVILSLNYGAAKRIRKVAVLSRGKKSNFELVEKLRDCVTFSLEAVGDRSLLPYSQFVIMATNYGKPVFEAAEIAPNAVTLSLGIDDMPPDYIEHVLSADGLIVADDLVAMEARNVDAVALYYSRRGMKLTQHGKRDGIKNYTEILDDEALMNDLKAWKGPANFSPVGLASIDVAVAAHVYETLLNKLAGPMEHGH